MTGKKEIVADLNFCKELMDRLVRYANENYTEMCSWGSKRTVIQNDIIKLRRELMTVSHKLDF